MADKKKNQVNNDLFDYVERVGYKTFEQLDFNLIDALILANISYYRFDFMEEAKNKSMTIAEAYNIISMYPALTPNTELSKLRLSFLNLLSKTIRYKDLVLFNYKRIFSEELEEQFSAICIRLNKQTVYVSYSGTDGTFTGWKEDFNMSYKKNVPSQLAAAEYINVLKKKIRKTKYIYVGGHSKGGNLSIYGSANAHKKVKERIYKIFNFDGPGFNKFSITPEIQETYNKVISVVPNMSIIGIIFNDISDLYVIESYGTGLNQHDCFNWKIKDQSFIYATFLSANSRCINKAINDYVEELSEEQRKEFMDITWELIENSNCEDADSLRNNSIKAIISMAKKYRKLPKERREFFRKTILHLIRSIQSQTKNFKNEINHIRYGNTKKFEHFKI